MNEQQMKQLTDEVLRQLRQTFDDYRTLFDGDDPDAVVVNAVIDGLDKMVGTYVDNVEKASVPVLASVQMIIEAVGDGMIALNRIGQVRSPVAYAALEERRRDARAERQGHNGREDDFIRSFLRSQGLNPDDFRIMEFRP